MICPNCKHQNLTISNFCSHCGQRLEKVISNKFHSPLRRLIFMFFLILAYITVIHLTDIQSNYISILKADAIFAILVLGIALLDLKNIISLSKPRSFSISLTLKIILITPAAAVGVYFLWNLLNQRIFDTSGITFYKQFEQSSYPMFFILLSVAFFPAVFEEIAFRGILFDDTLKIMGLKPAIITTSILFTVLHFSLVSALWLFPMGVLLGYLRAKYNTLIYGMILHFVYNCSVVVLQLLTN